MIANPGRLNPKCTIGTPLCHQRHTLTGRSRSCGSALSAITWPAIHHPSSIGPLWSRFPLYNGVACLFAVCVSALTLDMINCFTARYRSTATFRLVHALLAFRTRVLFLFMNQCELAREHICLPSCGVQRARLRSILLAALPPTTHYQLPAAHLRCGTCRS